MSVIRALVVLFLVSASAAAEPVKLRTLAGKTVEGELTGLSAREVVIKAADGAVVTPLTQAIDLELQPAGSPSGHYADLELTDGSLLHCAEYKLRATAIEVKLLAGAEAKIPLAAVSYLLNDAHEAKNREEFKGFLAKRGNRDLLAVKDAEGRVNPVGGTLGAYDEKAEKFGFETEDGSRYKVALKKIYALAFFHKPDPDAPAALCRAYDTGGDLLAVQALTLGDAVLTVTTPSGAKLEVPRAQLARIDFNNGKVAYLSDLQPQIQESSNVERVEHYRRDKNLDDAPIRLDKDGYAKGLSLHAYTELAYDLGGQYKELQAVVGVDASVAGDSHVRVLFEGDGRELASYDVEQKAGRLVVRGEGRDAPAGDPPAGPRKVAVDVRNVRQLRITVSSVGLLDLGNQVTLAEARVSK